MRKLEDHSSRSSAATAVIPSDRHSAGIPRSTSTASIKFVTHTPPPPEDPFKGLSYLRRKLKEDKFSKVSGWALTLYRRMALLTSYYLVALHTNETTSAWYCVCILRSQQRPGPTETHLHPTRLNAQATVRCFGRLQQSEAWNADCIPYIPCVGRVLFATLWGGRSSILGSSREDLSISLEHADIVLTRSC